MDNNCKSNDRNSEIVAFFYTIFGHRIHSGLEPDEARKEAYDAVTLRFGIGKGRLLNIISASRDSRGENKMLLRQNAMQLIQELRIANSGLDAAKEKNQRLIDLLEECLDDN